MQQNATLKGLSDLFSRSSGLQKFADTKKNHHILIKENLLAAEYIEGFNTLGSEDTVNIVNFDVFD